MQKKKIIKTKNNTTQTEKGKNAQCVMDILITHVDDA